MTTTPLPANWPSLRPLLVVALLVACARPAAPSPAPYRFTIGSLHAVALKDGDLHEENDGKTFGLGHAPAETAEVLARAGASTSRIDLSIQPLLVEDGERTMLFDTGALNAWFAKDCGGLVPSLRASGITPERVTDIFLSHGHQDHTGGLLTKAGALAFPNARVHLSAPEWDFLKTQKEDARLVAAITPKVDTFAPGARIFPSVTAVSVTGHTPGHSAYAIGTGEGRLLYLGDSVHHAVISVQKPDWDVEYDTDREAGRASRRAILARAASEDLRVYGVHFPYPGLGHVRAEGDGFVWVPDAL